MLHRLLGLSAQKIPVVLVKEGKTMIAENLRQDTPAPVRVTGTLRQLSEITHDLKNCMSILLYWVETLDTGDGSLAATEDSMDDLRNSPIK